MIKLSVGDRVKVYGPCYNGERIFIGQAGVVEKVWSDTAVTVLVEAMPKPNYFHSKQCRKLKPRNKDTREGLKKKLTEEEYKLAEEIRLSGLRKHNYEKHLERNEEEIYTNKKEIEELQQALLWFYRYYENPDRHYPDQENIVPKTESYLVMRRLLGSGWDANE